ncbi:NAD-dependent succinate-semialdehyde dehydrogenase [Larsenimonas rhizosphaerae]|uniref:NAD-dependent succinate-semialdehyde dehydrogenase n=1 Tax=Larsenimonas rhizosphaerae TaxID=2944682 RepID=A0AA41ZNF3_9GAMM|nr:NAD-dependent succinate-semialdehyde dehydrogenase [Larsenimonas rhizosphaerae]MCM2129459.1 NAD-dependent succinate-semialdehyde dehydrogenase [Larsenimonas rhizosphaerae]MCX2524115.1 NAD-dependent succinate-semialdehyde dehydrogenase [Larsenimonas rhizosphaerae]
MPNTVTTINPATGKAIREFDTITDEALQQKIEQSHQAFLEWKSRSISERGALIKKVGERLNAHKDRLVKLMTEEMGKPISQGPGEIDLCKAICDYSADNAEKVLADEERDLDGGRALVSYQPIGIIFGIQPWNFPFYQVVRYAIANLMAGNAVLLKHAPNVWGCAEALEEIFKEAGMPENIFSVLYIQDQQASQVTEHRLVRGVTFTGSAATGRKIAAAAGEQLKKTVLELGSNDAFLVLEDADIDKAVNACVMGRIYNNGQTCVAAKRFVVVDAVYDKFRDAFVEKMKNVAFGDPTDENTQLGPVARKDLRDALHQQVQESIENGATCVVGGELPDVEGFFYPATVLEDVKPGMPAYDGELFGPVASLIRATDEDDALRIANDSVYGLGGGIFSEDEERAVKLARDHFDTGMISINGYYIAQPNLPFGGVKDSGYGREHGGFGMREFVNIKSMMIAQ